MSGMSMNNKKSKPLNIIFNVPWKDMAKTLQTDGLSEGLLAESEKEIPTKIKRMLINAAVEYFAPYEIPMNLYKASVERTSDVTAEVIFMKKDNPEVKLVLGDIYFDESSGKILQATPQLG